MRHLPLLLALLPLTGCFLSDATTDFPLDADLDGGPQDGFILDSSSDTPPSIDGGFVDAGAPVDCIADDIEVNRCPPFECDEADRWYWSGHECFPVGCAACSGPDCEAGPFSREECEAAHDSCAPALCRASAGTWRFWAVDCGFECGQPTDVDCFDGGPTCDCGAFQTFDPAHGCVVDPTCAPDPEIVPPQTLCELSGGEWGGFCGHSHCGVRSILECEEPSCHCPWPQIFDENRGCVEGEACFRGDGGCDSRSLCPAGTACDAGGTCEGVICPFL